MTPVFSHHARYHLAAMYGATVEPAQIWAYSAPVHASIVAGLTSRPLEKCNDKYFATPDGQGLLVLVGTLIVTVLRMGLDAQRILRDVLGLAKEPKSEAPVVPPQAMTLGELRLAIQRRIRVVMGRTDLWLETDADQDRYLQILALLDSPPLEMSQRGFVLPVGSKQCVRFYETLHGNVCFTNNLPRKF